MLNHVYLLMVNCLIFFMCEKGIRQGENLSPLLFSIFLNNVEQFLCEKNCSGVNFFYEMGDIVIFLKLLIILYADDTVLMTENHKDMQTLLFFSLIIVGSGI